jgi:glycerol-3-phosphate dehydrogenase (NAD(P)+)
MKIAVLGAGGWGTTLAILLFYNHHTVTLWAYRQDYVERLIVDHENKDFLPGVTIPMEIAITSDLERAVANKQMIVLAVPSQFLRSVLERIPTSLLQTALLCNVAKGIENRTLLTMSGVLLDVHPGLKKEQIGVLSGPSHAEEVSRNVPTTVVISSFSAETAKVIQTTFMSPRFRVYANNDVLGVELSGALKNVIAVGAGICDGVGFGDNTKAAILTRGSAEITRLGIAMGAQAQTFSGLAGIGDLIVTCMSRHSRNRYVGEEIGKGRTLDEVLRGMKMVAEGVRTTESAYQLAQRHCVEMPITTQVYEILFKGKEPRQATAELMTRDAKGEVWG